MIKFIRGLSLKMPNNFKESFSDFLWSYWALSLPTYSSPIFIHRSQHFFQFGKHSWNFSFGILRSSASEFSLISWTDSNRRHFSTDFILVKRKKSPGTRSGEYSDWGTRVVSWFVRKSRIRRKECAGAFSWWSSHFFPSTNQAFFFYLPLSAFTSPSDNIPCSPSGHEVEIHDELRPHNQKTQPASLSHWKEPALFFGGLGDVFETYCEDWAFD